MCPDPKSAKKTDGLSVFFAFLGSASVKAERKHTGYQGKVTNIEYGKIDFKKVIIELLTSTRI